MGLNAYQQALKTTEDPRNTEYRLFAEITRDMMAAKQRGVRDAPFIAAVARNRQLWVTLASDCADDANRLPKETRAALVSLSIWVHKYSSEVSRGDGDVTDLIDVNRTIMKGLQPFQKTEDRGQKTE